MRTILAICILISVTPEDFAAPRSVTHEDIRDAILSFVHMFRDLSDKLERHEYRERQLGEQLKKALSTLDKRERVQDTAIDNIGASIAKIDARLEKIETILSQSERDREAYTVDTVPLQSWMSNMEGMLQQRHAGDNPNQDQLTTLLTSVSTRLDALESDVKNALTRVRHSSHSSPRSEQILNSVESELLLQNEWRNQITSTLDSHQQILLQLQSSFPNNELFTNMTEVMEFMKHELRTTFEREMSKLQYNIKGLLDIVDQGQDKIMKAISENNEMSEGFYGVIHKSYDQLSTEVKALGKVEKVLIQTADNVMDTKRRIEYGVQQILLEVGDLVKLQGKDLNTTMNLRFDGISEKILDNQNGALTNLSSKIETEISQVWRQIGIMYQQLTASAGALDRLQQQTETYVNGSLQTMDSMEGKVGQITGRMTEVDENLNYLLGRFSLVTQEFNQIKGALAKAIDNIKSSFRSVQAKIEEVGPGPNPIEPSNQSPDVDNTL